MTRRIPFLSASVPTHGGSDPDVVLNDNAIDDAREVYGGLPFDLDHLEQERCERAASGYHEYSIDGNWMICVHCKRDGGLV